MINVYNSVILPYFDYCSMVWENCGNCLLQRLQKMQNRAARVITGKTYEVRSSEILRELDWQTLEKRRKCNKAIFMYKINTPMNLRNVWPTFLMHHKPVSSSSSG